MILNQNLNDNVPDVMVAFVSSHVWAIWLLSLFVACQAIFALYHAHSGQLKAGSFIVFIVAAGIFWLYGVRLGVLPALSLETRLVAWAYLNAVSLLFYEGLMVRYLYLAKKAKEHGRVSS